LNPQIVPQKTTVNFCIKILINSILDPQAKKPVASKPIPAVSAQIPKSEGTKRRLSQRTYTVQVEVMDQATQTGDFDEPMEVGDENGCEFKLEQY
jgi:hypothetical protein